MRKKFKRQVFIGIAGVLVTALIGAAFIIWGLGVNEWVRYAALAVLLACFLGFFMSIFGGGKGFFSGFRTGAGFVILIVAAKELPIWVFGVLAVAAVIVLFALPLIRQYKLDREEDKYRVIDKSIDADILMEESEEDGTPQENDELKTSIAFGEKSLILLKGTGGMYQLIMGEGGLYFLRVGGEISGMDVQLLRTDFSDESSYIVNKKDFFIASNSISKIKCKYGKVIGTERSNSGELLIDTYQRRYSFAILDRLTEKRIEAYFAGLPFEFKGKPKSKNTASPHVLTEEEKAILPRIKSVSLALIVTSSIFSAAFIFFPDDRIIYRVLSAFCILIPAVTFALYVKFNTLLSLDDTNTSTFKKTGVSIFVPLLFPCLALGIRTLLDFNILGLDRLFAWSAAIIAVVLLILFTLTKEYKRKKSIIIVIVLAFLFYAPSAVIQLNCLYDYSTPAVNATTLLDKHISNVKYSTFYYFTVELGNGNEKDIKVSKEFYEQRDKGSTVSVAQRSGLLGVDYVYIDENE